jgi:hypothetical protein
MQITQFVIGLSQSSAGSDMAFVCEATILRICLQMTVAAYFEIASIQELDFWDMLVRKALARLTSFILLSSFTGQLSARQYRLKI